MWISCLITSVLILVLITLFLIIINNVSKKNYSIFNMLFASTVAAAFFAFIPIHTINSEFSCLGIIRIGMLSLFNSIQLFMAGCDYAIVTENITSCPDGLNSLYQVWMGFLFVVAPLFTFGFVLSLFKNVFAYLRYLCSYFKDDVYVFSELNEKSYALASDIKNKNRKAVIVFTDVFDGDEEKTYELIERTKEIGAINFKKDILVVDFKKHSSDSNISFFAIGENETENLNQALKLIDAYKERENTHLYVFSTKIESELLLSTVNKGQIKVRRVNEVQSLVNRILYEKGELLFKSAIGEGDEKTISVIMVGMGCHGTEFVKALTWFGQMDGYKIEINAFDNDPLAEEKFMAMAPELMDKNYNGVSIKGEAEYRITIHSSIDVNSKSFVDEISKISNATFAIVALGDDDVNINTAVNLRMYFERMNIHPTIQAIVYNSQQKNALAGIKNYRGQEYDIEFIGDISSSYTEDVIIDSELEDLALERHLKWGDEEEFWAYEYNYRSSVASAIHLKARVNCGIPGASKKEEDLTIEEREIIESLEHRRWNAYMRAEGYIYSGSKDKSSRNDLGKMHHDLIDFSSLSEEEKRKDSKVGTS